MNIGFFIFLNVRCRGRRNFNSIDFGNPFLNDNWLSHRLIFPYTLEYSLQSLEWNCLTFLPYKIPPFTVKLLLCILDLRATLPWGKYYQHHPWTKTKTKIQTNQPTHQPTNKNTNPQTRPISMDLSCSRMKWNLNSRMQGWGYQKEFSPKCLQVYSIGWMLRQNLLLAT